jgi:hypothetical protein
MPSGSTAQGAVSSPDDGDKGGSTQPPPSWDGTKDAFAQWKRKVQVWKLSTAAKPSKQAAMVICRLQGRPQELALEMKDEDIAAEDGLAQLLTLLEEKFGATETQRIFNSFKELINMRWSTGSVEDFLASFEVVYSKASAGTSGVKLSTTVQAMLVLHAARLSDSEEVMVLANIQEPMDYAQVRAVLTKLFRDKKRSKQAYVTVADGYDGASDGVCLDGAVMINGEVFFPEDHDLGNDATDPGTTTEDNTMPDVLWVKGKKFLRFKSKGKGKGKGHKGNKGNKGQPRDPKDVKCYACGEKGHYANACPKKPKEANVVFTVGTGSGPSN